MSALVNPITPLAPAETSPHQNPTSKDFPSAMSRTSGPNGLQAAKQSSNSSKTYSKSGQLVFTAQSGNFSSGSTLASSGLLYTPLSSGISNPYALPSQPRIFSRNSTPIPATRTTMVKSVVGFERNKSNRSQVERAMREHKIFSCIGVYPAIRKALAKRGWVEKNPSLGIARSTNLGTANKELDARGYEDESDQAWMNRVLRDYPPDFTWVIRRDNIDWRSLHKDQVINRFPKAFFTTKVGITACLQNMQWFSETGISDTFFPRCYRLCIDEEKMSFIDDYRLSACMGLLKWVVSAYEREGESGVMDPGSRVVSLAVDFAVRQVNNYVRMRRHEDIDWLMPPAFMGQHWDVFLNQYYNVVLLRSRLAPNDSQDTGKLKYETAKRALQRISPFWPQLNIDGMSNIWICKPGARSRGKGIVIMNQLDKILDLLSQNNYREANWVVQKYIERPMVIYKTKFDIRQWFIVSDWSPLTLWFYKESYIRFCSKPFSLDDFHESIHLCNNAVQCRYQNSDIRDSALPDENMWDCYTFQSYLKSIGKYDMWDSVIYPGMKQGILGVMLASQETVDVHKNCFELYGADFMLSDDLRPWLIEINSCPCMAPSTSVTARMCTQCLEDCIKVVIDRREDKSADTGLFELIYKQNQSNVPLPFNSVDLIVQGKKLSRDVDWPSKRSGSSTSSTSRVLRASPQPTSMANGLTFMDLVQRLRLKDAQNESGPAKSLPNTSVLTGPSSKSGVSGSKSGHKTPTITTTTEGKMSTSSVVSVKKTSNNEGGNGRATVAAANVAFSPSHNNNATNNASGPDNKYGSKSTEKKSSLHDPTKGSKGSGRRVRVRTQNTNNTEQQQGQSSHPRHSNTETLLSTLIKSSLTNQPTMADLVRLSSEATKEAVQRAKVAPNYGRTSQDSDEASENRSGSNTSNKTKSSLSVDTPLKTGKIRPNAVTSPSALKNLSNNNTLPPVVGRSKSKESRAKQV